ncbi:MAG: InlB B-repeat-containing protein, partial [Oscillospiraceae bacterium]|nr:InlB B-repeat-containing protein [Oscillospiraceae bacterium]
SAIGATETGNKNFYAKWTAQSYTVGLIVNGGTIVSGNVTGYTYGVGATLPTEVQREGHDFGGWYDNAELSGQAVSAISATETGNKSFYAKWTPETYDISMPDTDSGYIVEGTDGTESAAYGTSWSFTVSPAEQLSAGSVFELSYTVKANGVELNANNAGVYTIENIDSDQVITVGGGKVTVTGDMPESSERKLSFESDIVEEIELACDLSLTSEIPEEIMQHQTLTVAGGFTLTAEEGAILKAEGGMTIQQGAALVVRGELYIDGSAENYGSFVTESGGVLLISGSVFNGGNGTFRDGSGMYAVGQDGFVVPAVYNVTLNAAEGVSAYEFSVDGGDYMQYSSPIGLTKTQSVSIRAVMQQGYTLVRWREGDENETITVSGLVSDLTLTPTTKYVHEHPSGEVVSDFVPCTEFDTAWTASGGQIADGAYYMTSDVTAQSDIVINGTVHLDLNGHVLDMGAYRITVNEEATLCIYDCGSGSISGTPSDAEGGADKGVIDTYGSMVIFGGSVTSAGSDPGSPALSVGPSGTVEMMDGSLYSPVETLRVSGAFMLRGGDITSDGTAVELLSQNEDTGVLTVVGGNISGNECGVLSTGGALTVSGGALASGQGCAVSAEGGMVEISGGVFSSGKDPVDMIGGFLSVSGTPVFNFAQADAGGIFLACDDSSMLVMEGAPVMNYTGQGERLEADIIVIPFDGQSGSAAIMIGGELTGGPYSVRCTGFDILASGTGYVLGENDAGRFTDADGREITLDTQTNSLRLSRSTVTVTLDAVGGLTVIDPDTQQTIEGPVTLQIGTDFSFTVLPDQDSGYSGAEVWLTGEHTSRLSPADGIYTLRNITEDTQLIISGAVELTESDTGGEDLMTALLNKNIGLITINCDVAFGGDERTVELNPQRRIVVESGSLEVAAPTGLLIAEGAELEITSSGIVRVLGAGDVSVCGLMIGGTVIADGSLMIEANGYVENYGTIALGESGCLDIGEGVMYNAGTIGGIGLVFNADKFVNEGELSNSCSLQNGGVIIASEVPETEEDGGVIIIGSGISTQVGFERGDEECFIGFEIKSGYRADSDFAISVNGVEFTPSASGKAEPGMYMLQDNYCDLVASVSENDEHVIVTVSGIIAE